jgi:hypothetical protein
MGRLSRRILIRVRAGAPAGREIAAACAVFAVMAALAALAAPARAQVLADSACGFSPVQGLYGWSYGYYDGPYTSASFKPMTEFDGQAWFAHKGSYWTQLFDEGGHPNGRITTPPSQPVEQWAVRRWTSPLDGTVMLSGNYAKIAVTCGGVGSVGHILVDGTEVWTQSVAAGDTTGVNYTLTVPVHTGSVVDFAIGPGPNSTDYCDTSRFTARIALGPDTTLAYGDVNGDGQVNRDDVLLVLQVSAGRWSLAGTCVRSGDVAPKPSADPRGFGDGRLDIRDVARLLRRLANLEPVWP